MLGEMAKQGGEEARQTSLLCSDCHTAMATVLCCATRLCARHLYCTPHLHHRKQWKVINRSQFNKQNAQAEKVSPGLPRTPNVVSCSCGVMAPRDSYLPAATRFSDQRSRS